MILLMIPIGVIFQYFYLVSKSIFVPALAHGALNWTATTYLMFVFDSEKIDTMLHDPTGITGLIVWRIFGIWFFIKFKTYYNSMEG